MSINRSRLHAPQAGMISRRDMLARCSTGFGLVALSGLAAEGKALAAAPATFPPKGEKCHFLFYVRRRVTCGHFRSQAALET